MTNVVGSASIEFTGDLSAFADNVAADLTTAFDALQSIVDDGFARIVEQFGTAGTDAGTAFTDTATALLADGGTTAAVDASAADAATAAADGWANVGAAAGTAYADTASAGIASTDTIPAIDASAADAADHAANAWGDAGGAASDAYGSALSDGLSSDAPAAADAATAATSEVGSAATVELGAAGAEAAAAFNEKLREGLALAAETIGVGVATLGLGALLTGSVEAAVGAQNAAIKTKNVFGESSEAITQWAENGTTRLRETAVAIETSAGAFAQFLKASGVATDRIPEMSQKLVEVTANVAAFNQVSTDTVQSAFQAALRGRVVGLKQFGIEATPAMLGAEAVAHGIVHMDAAIGGTVPTLDAAQKAQAAYYLILDQTKNQQNGLASSADSMAAKQALLSVKTEELKVKVGDVLLPALTSLTGFLTADVVPALEDVVHFVQENATWIAPLAKAITLLGGAWVFAKVGMGAFHLAQQGFAGVQSLYLSGQLAIARATDAVGLSSGRAAALTAAANTTTAASSEAAAAAVVAAQAEVVAAREAAAAATFLTADEQVAAQARVVAADEAAAVAATAAAEEEGAASTLALGPIGLAVGAVAIGLGIATHGFGLFGGSAKAAIGPVQDLTNAIQQDSGALGDNTRQAVANRLEKDGLLDKGVQLGISQKTLTDAVLGNGAAMTTVNAAIAAHAVSMDHLGNLYDANGNRIVDFKGKEAQLGNVSSELKDKLGDETAALGASKTAADNVAAATAGATAKTVDYAAAVKDANTTIDTFGQTQFAAAHGLDAYKDSLVTLTETIKKNGKTWDANTVAGRANREALIGAAEKAAAFAKQQKDAGVPTLTWTRQLHDNAQQIIDTAVAAGATKADVAKLLHTMGLTPGDISTTFHSNALEQKAAFDSLLSSLQNLQADAAAGVNVNVTASGTGYLAMLAGNFAGGGTVGDGLFVVGEQGPELGYKSGSHVEIIDNATTMRGFANGAAAAAAPTNTGGGGLSDADRALLLDLANRPYVIQVDGRDLARATNTGQTRLARLA